MQERSNVTECNGPFHTDQVREAGDDQVTRIRHHRYGGDKWLVGTPPYDQSLELIVRRSQDLIARADSSDFRDTLSL